MGICSSAKNNSNNKNLPSQSSKETKSKLISNKNSNIINPKSIST